MADNPLPELPVGPFPHRGDTACGRMTSVSNAAQGRPVRDVRTQATWQDLNLGKSIYGEPASFLFDNYESLEYN